MDGENDVSVMIRSNVWTFQLSKRSEHFERFEFTHRQHRLEVPQRGEATVSHDVVGLVHLLVELDEEPLAGMECQVITFSRKNVQSF